MWTGNRNYRHNTALTNNHHAHLRCWHKYSGTLCRNTDQQRDLCHRWNRHRRIDYNRLTSCRRNRIIQCRCLHDQRNANSIRDIQLYYYHHRTLYPGKYQRIVHRLCQADAGNHQPGCSLCPFNREHHPGSRNCRKHTCQRFPQLLDQCFCNCQPT